MEEEKIEMLKEKGLRKLIDLTNSRSDKAEISLEFNKCLEDSEISNYLLGEYLTVYNFLRTDGRHS